MKQQLTPRINRNEPNIIIDGGMEIWPEGTSRSIVNNSSLYGAALFQCINTSSGITLTNSQQASIPSGTSIPFSNQVSKTAAGTLAAGTNTNIFYGIEGYDIQRLFVTEFSVLFWVKSSVASNRSLSVKSSNSSHSYVQQYNIAAANTWQLVALKIPALSSCPATLNRTNGVGIQLGFPIVSGSTFQTSTLNAWQSGNFLSGTGEDTTWLTGTTHDFSVAGVMVLPGDWTSLVSNTSSYRFLRSGRNFQEEVAKTQRYYEKSYEMDTSPGATTFAPGFADFSGATNTNAKFITAYFKSQKRAIPTIVFYNPSTGTSGQINLQGTGVTAASDVIGSHSFNGGTNNATNTFQFNFHWTADSRF